MRSRNAYLAQSIAALSLCMYGVILTAKDGLWQITALMVLLGVGFAGLIVYQLRK